MPLRGEGSDWYEKNTPHDTLVRAIRGFVEERRTEYKRMGVRHDMPSAEIIRRKLDWESGVALSRDPQKGDYIANIRYAFDALAYDYYEPGTTTESLAGATLAQYYDHTGESHIELDPGQVKIIDALTEASYVPHTMGKSTIEIAKKHQNRTKWLLSDEYARRIARAKAVQEQK